MEYRIWTDETNIWHHVSGNGLDETEQLPNYLSAERTVIIDALYAGARDIEINGEKVDVIEAAQGDPYIRKYHSDLLDPKETGA